MIMVINVCSRFILNLLLLYVIFLHTCIHYNHIHLTSKSLPKISCIMFISYHTTYHNSKLYLSKKNIGKLKKLKSLTSVSNI